MDRPRLRQLDLSPSLSRASVWLSLSLSLLPHARDSLSLFSAY